MPDLSRRDLLRLALGAPMLAALGPLGCGRARVFEGELVDFGRERAHRGLRGSGATLANVSADVVVERAEVVVVGAGIAGLTAAWRLAAAGVDVRVLELDDVVGGTARGGASEVTGYPWAAHYVVAPFSDDRVMVRLLSELGVFDGVDAAGHPRVSEVAGMRELEERHFYRGKFGHGLYPIEDETADEKAQRERFVATMNTFADATRDGRRAFTLPVALASGAHLDLDVVTFGEWLRTNGFTSWRLRWLCDYACRDDYGTGVDATSAWAGVLYFCARRRPHEGYDDRAVITWPEGNARIVAHLEQSLGARIVRGAMATDIAEVEGRVRVLCDGRVFDAAHVIVATPRFVAARIVKPLREARPAWLDAFTTAPWVVANVHLRERPEHLGWPVLPRWRAKAEHVGTAQMVAGLNAWDTVFVESASVGYVTATHQSGRDVGPTVLTWYRPLTESAPSAERQQLEALGHAHWAEACVSELELAHPDIRELITRVDIGRLGHGMVRPTPGLRQHLGAAAQSIGRVHFAHTDLSGVALCEEAADHGVRAAELALAELRPGSATWR